MMTYDTWKSETSRGFFTPRSKALEAVDKAFLAYKGSPTSVKKIDLWKALKAWAEGRDDGKPWKQSTRNSTLVNNKGTVERLLDDLAGDPTIGGQVRQFLNAPPPLPVGGGAYVPGKRESSKDKDNEWHDFIRQERGNSCVCSTVAMMKRAWHSTINVSEEQIRGSISLFETGNFNKGISAISPAAQNHQDWQTVGTNPQNAVGVLKAQPFPILGAHEVTGGDQATLLALQGCTSKKPGLIGWLWTGGGGHFTLCIGPTKDGSELKIIDPWDGIVYVPNTSPGFKTYNTNGGAVGNLAVAIVG